MSASLSGPTPIVQRIIVDGDWATVLFDSTDGRGHNGTDYTMTYCWLMRVEDGLIREVIGFYDQVKVTALFA
jgi:ketosteroid isomerase-like protein